MSIYRPYSFDIIILILRSFIGSVCPTTDIPAISKHKSIIFLIRRHLKICFVIANRNYRLSYGSFE